MSPPEVWGPAIWILFHTLSEKVSEQAYPFIKGQLFTQIRRICSFLPCPECSADATNFLAKINVNDLKTKIEFRNTFYLFHNWVNAKKRKPLFNYSKLESYNNYGIIPVINNFISKYNTKGNMKFIAESFQRQLIVGEFKSWFTKTILAFRPPQNIPSHIPEITIDKSVSITEEVHVTEDVVVPIVEDVVVPIVEAVPIVVEEVPLVEEVPIVEEVVVTQEVSDTEEVSHIENIILTEELQM